MPSLWWIAYLTFAFKTRNFKLYFWTPLMAYIPSIATNYLINIISVDKMVTLKGPSRHGCTTLPIKLITSISRPSPFQCRALPFSPVAQASSRLNTDAAISVRGLQLSFGGGGSRKQVRSGKSRSPPPGLVSLY